MYKRQVSNITTAINQIQIFDSTFTQLEQCSNCGPSRSYSMPAGRYIVIVKMYTDNFVQICQKLAIINISGLVADTEAIYSRDVSNTSLETNNLSNSIKVYPNPVSDELMIDLDSYSGKSGLIQLYNQVGQLTQTLKVEEIGISPVRLQVGQQPSGLYHVMIFAEGKRVKVEKIVIH